MILPAPSEGPAWEWATYRLRDRAVAVATDDRDTGRWLAEFLDPWFSVERSRQAATTVRFTARSDEFSDLQRRRTRMISSPVPVFALDRVVVSLPGWIGPDGVQVVADDEQECFYLVSRDVVRIVARPGNRRSRVALLRVVRELIAAPACTRPGLVDLHAAAFVVGGRAVLLVGPKQAGKTTLLVYALTSGHADLLANDRVFVDIASGCVCGVPTMVVVREGTARLFPALARRLTGWAALLHCGELAAGVASGGQRLVLSPAQLARQTGAATVPHAPLGAIVFPRLSAETRSWSLEPAPRAEARAWLRGNLYGARAASRERTLFQEVLDAPCRAKDPMPERLLATVPLLSCRLGPDAYRTGADAWLRALPVQVATA